MVLEKAKAQKRDYPRKFLRWTRTTDYNALYFQNSRKWVSAQFLLAFCNYKCISTLLLIIAVKVQRENKNLENDVAAGSSRYKELFDNFDKLDSLTKRLVMALSSKSPDPTVKTQPSQELYYKASALSLIHI